MSLRHVTIAAILAVSLNACTSTPISAQAPADTPEAEAASPMTAREKAFQALDAQSESAIAVVKQYMDAYSRLDIEAMAEFYPDDVKLIDLTSTNTPLASEPFIYNNKQELMAIMNQMPQFYEGLKFEVDRIWESSGYVVVVSDTISTIKTPDGPHEIIGQAVNVFKVEDGKISELRDYSDYNKAARSYP